MNNEVCACDMAKEGVKFCVKWVIKEQWVHSSQCLDKSAPDAALMDVGGAP